ncbi:MAG: penicillin-binding protein 2 [Desulfobacteraceae bacterium]|nr:penicillin-binding protein 2 [Desulfobacteraceae bacterium]
MGQERKKGIRARIVVVEVFFFLVILLLGAKAVEIQILESSVLSKKATDEYTGTVRIQGKRGEILDRNMNRLATTIDALSVAASARKIENPAADARAIARVLKVDRVKLRKKLSTNRSFVPIKRKISPAEVRELKALNIKGLIFQNDVIRFYPNRGLAGQVIGFTGSDAKGLEGLEFGYDSVLQGEQTRLKVTRDATGRQLDPEKYLKERFSGGSLVLTIDRTIQYISECALKDAVTSFRGKSGMAVVMRPRTGEVLAMALYPEFNPNAFSASTRERWRNRVVTDPFEPGSVMKVFVAASAMDKGYCTPKSIFFCENGAYKVGSKVIHDTHDSGWLTLGQILKYSSNIGMVKITETTGKKALYDALTGFGFGTRTGLGCPGESPGTLTAPARWSAIDASAITFGQGMSVTALQLASGFSAIANDGVLMRPLLVKKTLLNSGETDRVFEPQVQQRVISKHSARAVRKMMRAVVSEGGTGASAALEGYSVCGKTGTAQKVAKNGRGYSRNLYTAAFAGFAPEVNPELAIVVVVDEPRKSHYGSKVAAPAFKSILAKSFHYLNIPPDLEREQIVAGISDGAKS